MSLIQSNTLESRIAGHANRVTLAEAKPVRAGRFAKKLPTDREADMLRVFERLIAKHDGKCPTYQEVADEMGITKVTVYGYVINLRDKGYLAVDPHKARAVKILKPSPLGLHEWVVEACRILASASRKEREEHAKRCPLDAAKGGQK